MKSFRFGVETKSPQKLGKGEGTLKRELQSLATKEDSPLLWVGQKTLLPFWCEVQNKCKEAQT